MTWWPRPPFGPAGQGWVKDVPVGDVAAGVLAPPLLHDIGNMRDAHAQDEQAG
jgi:hypothetical protein